MCGKFFFNPANPKHTKGQLCQSVLIIEKLNIKKEIYLSIDYSRTKQCPVITYSTKGGMAIEKIITNYPEEVFRIYLNVLEGLTLSTLNQVSNDL